MASLLNDLEKTEYGNILLDLADTFERDITIYSPAREAIINSTDFNSFFQNREDSVTPTPVSTTIKARIKYNPKQERQFNNEGAQNQQLDVTEDLGDVRIKVRAANKALVLESISVEINSEQFQVITCHRPHGLFDTQFETFYLRRRV